MLLVAATFAAFFVAQRLKSAPPVAVTCSSITQHFSPNGDGRRDVARIRVRVRSDDDVTSRSSTTPATEVRRLATAVPAAPSEPLRLSLGRRPTNDGAARREGVYRVRVSLRRGGRAVTLEPGRRPRPDRAPADGHRRRARRRRLDHRPGRGAGPVPRAASSRGGCRRASASAHGPRASPQRGGRVRRCRRASARASGTGTADGAPAPPGTYQIVAAVRDQAGNVGRSAPVDAGPDVRGAARGERARAARAAAGRPGARRRARRRSRSTRAGARTAGASSASASASRGVKGRQAQTGRRVPGHRARRRVRASTCSTCRDRHALDDGPVRGPGRRQRADPRRAARAITWFGRDTLDDDRDGLPNTLDERQLRRLPAAARRAACPPASPTRSRRCSPSWTRQKIHYDVTTDLTLAASRAGLVRRAPGRAARRPAALDLRPSSRAGCAATSPRAAASRRSAPTRCAAASRSRATGCCARCRRATPTRSATRLRAAAHAARAATPLAADRRRGRHRPADRRRRSCRASPRSRSPSPSRAGRVASRSPRSTRRRSSAAETADEPLPENFPALALTRGRRRDGDPRRAARVGRAAQGRAPCRCSSSPATSPTSCAAPSRRSGRSRCRCVDVDTAAGPEAVRAIGIVIAAALAAGGDPRAARRAGARLGDARRARAHAGAARALDLGHAAARRRARASR